MPKINIKYASLYSSLNYELKKSRKTLKEIDELIENPQKIGFASFSFATKEAVASGRGGFYSTQHELHKLKDCIEFLKICQKHEGEHIRQILRIQEKLIKKSSGQS